MDHAVVQRYRLIARIACRSLALLLVLWGVGLCMRFASTFTLRSFPVMLVEFFRDGSAIMSIFMLAAAFVLARFDGPLSRWLVPAPKPGCCPRCGYSLKDLASPICPECGADLRPRQSPKE
jgi:hypothetical protein